MPLHRVFKILFLCFLAAFALGCGSGSDDNFSNFQSFQNNDAPVRLRFQTLPSRAAGAPFGTINVAVVDFNGLVVTTDTRPVTISLTQPNGATLSGTTTVNAVDGVASFTGLSVNLLGTYTFTATAEGLLPAESAPFTITSGAANTINVLQGFPGPPGPMENPDNTNSIVIGQAVNPPVRIQVLDAAGNPAPDGTSVSIVTAVDPTGQTQTTGNRVQTVGGVATFDNFVVTSGGGATVFVAAVSGAVRTAPLQTFVLGNELNGYGIIQQAAGNPLVISRTPFFPTPGASQVVGSIPGYDVIRGLEALPNGNLIAVAQRIDNDVFEIFELSPGVPTTFVAGTNRAVIGIPAGVGPTDLTVDPSTGQLYAFYGAPLPVASQGLYQIDRATGVPSRVGDPGLPAVGEGLAWEPFVETPFIYTGGGATADGLSIFNVSTGAATQIAANPVLALAQLTVNPYDTNLYGLVPGTGIFIISKTDGTFTGPLPLPDSNLLSAAAFLSEEPTP